MQQSYLHILSSDNTINKNELTSFIHTHDSNHPAITGNTYLTGEKDNKQVTETKKNDDMIMLDIFGALNY